MLIGIIIGLILIFPILRNTFNEITAPDKVLVVLKQVDEHTMEVTKEIKDKEKITDFENIFDEISFEQKEWEEESYADVIVQINHKKGIYTHPLKIWFNVEEGTAQMYTIEDKEIGKLSSTQVKALQEILN